ncbi:MAG: thioesterase family protein [Mucinivorans sp.]
MLVTAHNSAIAMGSGDLPVFATPAMVALMEREAALLASSFCSAQQTTVGVLINIEHLRATPLGGDVWAEAKLLGQEGRKLMFSVEAFDDNGLIGHGEHHRFMVDRQKFMSKL